MPTAPPNQEPRTKTVLVAEDESGVRRLVKRILVRKGYRVIEAASGADALAMADALDEPIDVLLTDMIMPGMSGAELASRLSAARPELPTLFMSGYPELLSLDPATEGPTQDYLQKPFTSDELIKKLEELLGRH
jgi:two-component system cell cycle sensor histidine kinase/response regulator CckA